MSVGARHGSDLRSRLYDLARRGWRATPLGRLLRTVAREQVQAAAVALQTWSLPDAAREAEIAPGPLIVSGFLSSALGIGRAARLTVAALRAAGLEVLEHDLSPILDDETRVVPLPTTEPGGVWLMHCNAPEALHVMATLDPEARNGRYVIGYWAWELSTLPPAWIRASRSFNEIWAPSRFVAAAAEGVGPKVRVMPHPVPSLGEVRPDRARFGLTDGCCTFLTQADLRSTGVRKNPRGAVEAYLRAFPSPSAGGALVVKLMRAEADPDTLAILTARARGRPDVRLLDEELDDAGMLSLLASADALVSLHRSEGFGLALAEALALGKAVVATGWSGNVDFMGGELADMLTPYRLVPVEDPSGRYSGDELWAEPDLDAAAAILRRLVADPGLRARMARLGPRAAAETRDAWTAEALSALPMAAHLRQRLAPLERQRVAV